MDAAFLIDHPVEDIFRVEAQALADRMPFLEVFGHLKELCREHRFGRVINGISKPQEEEGVATSFFG